MTTTQRLAKSDVAITPLTDDQSAVPPISEMFIHETLSGDPASSYQLPVVKVNGHAIKGLLHRIVATSSDPSIIPDPSVAYSSTDVPSQISFAPVNDAHGIATISVQVEDGGLDNNFETTEDNRQFTYQYEVNVLEIISKAQQSWLKTAVRTFMQIPNQCSITCNRHQPISGGFMALGATTDGNENALLMQRSGVTNRVITDEAWRLMVCSMQSRMNPHRQCLIDQLEKHLVR